MALLNLAQKKNTVEKIDRKKRFVPKWMLNDPNFRFGKPAFEGEN